MPSIVNQMAARQLTAAYDGTEGLVVVGLRGLTMKENESLRVALAEQGVRLRMVPNRVARKALAEVGFDFPAQSFKGNVGLAGGDVEQTIHAAKVLSASPLKKAGKVELLAGALEGNVLGAADAGALADVPDRRTLQGKLLGCLNGPAQQLASLLNGPSGALVRVVNAHADASGAGEPAG